MSLTIDQPESIDAGGKFVSKPGIYHFIVTDVDEAPADRDGNLLNGLKVSTTVLAGTNPDQKDMQFEMMLWHPKPEDSSDMPKKKQTRFCLATNLLSDHQPGKRVSVEPQNARGQQLVAKLSWRQKKNEQTGKYEDTDKVDLSFADIFHVDDEWVAKNNVPLDQQAISMIPPANRKAQQAAPNPPTANPNSGAVNLDAV